MLMYVVSSYTRGLFLVSSSTTSITVLVSRRLSSSIWMEAEMKVVLFNYYYSGYAFILKWNQKKQTILHYILMCRFAFFWILWLKLQKHTCCIRDFTCLCMWNTWKDHMLSCCHKKFYGNMSDNSFVIFYKKMNDLGHCVMSYRGLLLWVTCMTASTSLYLRCCFIPKLQCQLLHSATFLTAVPSTWTLSSQHYYVNAQIFFKKSFCFLIIEKCYRCRFYRFTITGGV